MFEASPFLPTIIFPSSPSVIYQPVQSACFVCVGCHCNHVCEHNGWMTGREYREIHWRRSETARARCGGVDAWNFFYVSLV